MKFEDLDIHVARDDFEAKFWLKPLILAKNYGLPPHEIPKILGIIRKNEHVLMKAWEEYHE